MNRLELGIGTLVLAVVLGFLSGPLDQLANMPDGALSDGGYWRNVAEDGIRSGAEQTKGVIAVVASALGITMYQRARGVRTSTAGEIPTGDSPPGT